MDFVVDVLRAVVMLGFVGLAILVLAGLFMIVFSLATSIDKRVSVLSTKLIVPQADRLHLTFTDAPSGFTLLAVRHYRFDHLPSGGILNLRGRVVGGLRDNVRADLVRLKRDSESSP